MTCRTKSCRWWALAALFGTIAIICLMLLLLASPAKGEPLLGNRASCAHLGALAVDIRETRDNGATWDVLEPFLTKNLKEAQQNPKSYVQTDADLNYVLSQLKKAFESKEESYVAGTAVYYDCMAKRV